MNVFTPYVILIAVVLLTPSRGEATCFTCHDKTEFSGKTIHQPVKNSKCSQCHNPHVAHFPGLLHKETSALCFSCHTEEKKSFFQGRTHEPVRKGQCLSCHEPHAAEQKGLLKENLSATCFSCHTELQAKYDQSHAPFAKGDCLICHSPHQADQANLMRDDADIMCLNCHKRNDVNNKHKNFPKEAQGCLTCHAPHGSSQKGLIRDTTHPPFKKDCRQCHKQGQHSVPTSTCLSCHEEVGKARQAIHHHLGGGHANSCTICHSPHAADNEQLLKGDQQDICLSCHANIDRQMRESLFIHEGPKKCSECHDTHGSNRPAMLRGDGNAVCDRCHETQGTFTHPVGEKIIDPRTGLMVTCVSCHNPMGSNFKYELKLSGSKDLCIQCHKRY